MKNEKGGFTMSENIKLCTSYLSTIPNAAARREKILVAMIYTFVSILAVAILSWIMFNSLNTPEVEVSWSTKQCIRVVYMDGTTDTCDNKPEKYDIVWVK